MELNDHEDEVIEDTEEETDEELTGDSTEEETTKARQEKPKRSPEEQLKYLEGRTARLRKKLGLTEERKAPKSETKTDGLDKLDRAVLRVEKITAPAEIELVQDWMKDTGKDVEQVLASTRFQAELSELREKAATKAATPQNSRRSGQTARDEVDYWLAKGPGPDGLPKDNPELARKVVAARTHKAKNANQFTDDPIA